MARQTRRYGVYTTKATLVRDEVLRGYVTKSESGQVKKGEDVWSGAYENEGLVQPPIDPQNLIDLLDLNTYHRRACEIVAQDVAGLGHDVILDEDEGGKEADRKRLKDFYQALSAPISATLRNMVYDLRTFGYAYIELVRETPGDPNSEPVELYHVEAHTIRAHKDGKRYRQMRGRQKSWFVDVDYAEELSVDRETGEETDGPGEKGYATEIMRFQTYAQGGNSEQFYGKPGIVPALMAMQGDLGRERYNIAFFDNYGMPSYAVFVTGDFDEGEWDEVEQRSELQKKIEEQFQSFQGDGSHGVMVFTIPSVPTGEGRDSEPGEVEVRIEPLSTEVKDASFEVYRKSNRDEIIVSSGVPKRRMGVEEEGALAGNSAREMNAVYKESVLSPLQEAIESVLARYVAHGGFGIEGLGVRFELERLNTKDEKLERENTIALQDNAIISPNEARQRLGLQPVKDPAMDKHYYHGKPLGTDPEKERMQALLDAARRVDDEEEPDEPPEEDADDPASGADAA